MTSPSGDELRKFILDPNLSDTKLEKILKEICDYDSNPCLPQAALTARGLFAGDILRSALHKRHRVEFGVDNVTWRCQMAIPFRFKDAPSERTEFGHPDLAITLTLRAYAEDGLTKASFRQVLHWLKELPLQEQTLRYRLWLLAAAGEADCTEAVEKTVAKRLKIPRNAEGLNVDDEMIDRLWPKLRTNLRVIEMFLEVFVFPKETRQFPFKVSSSAWDLAFGRLRGFSGTADNRQLLPLGVQQYEDKMLQHTDGRALRSLCDPEMGGPSPVKVIDNKEPLEILREILLPENSELPVSVLIDCGALLTGMSNRQVAQSVLNLCNRFRAAIYFDDNNQILVLDRDGRHTPLAKSPLQPVHECFTYLDDKHTRGTDLRFAPAAVGAVTICKKTTKDRLVQAAMRMRSLGLGQKVVLFVDSEAGRQLAAEAVQEHQGMNPRPVPSLGLVLAFVTARTAEELKAAIVFWALQGAAFATRMPFLESVLNGEAGARSLAKLCREPEEFQLSSYYQSLAACPSAEEIPRRAHETPKRILATAGFTEQDAEHWEKTARQVIENQLSYLSQNQLLCSENALVNSMDEEQEREREQEKEREKEVEMELEAEVCPPAINAHTRRMEEPWEWSRALQQGFVADCLNGSAGCPRLHPITAEELENCGLPLPQLQDLRKMPSHIFVTRNWLYSVTLADANCSPVEKAHSLRPVDAYLLVRKDQVTSIILLSGFEAGQILREMRYLNKHAPQRATQAEEFSAQLCHLSDTGKSMSVCPWGYPKLPHPEHRAVLKLFNGSCDYPPTERLELAKFLGLLGPSSIYKVARHHLWNQLEPPECRRLWDALRDFKILSRNGFVKYVPDMEAANLRKAVDSVLEHSEDYASKMAWLHRLLTQISSGHKNPAGVVPELVRFRLQGHLFQGSSLEELLDL